MAGLACWPALSLACAIAAARHATGLNLGRDPTKMPGALPGGRESSAWGGVYGAWAGSDGADAVFGPLGTFEQRERVFGEACAARERGVPGAAAAFPLPIWTEQEQSKLCHACMLVGNFFTSNPEWQSATGYGLEGSESVSHSGKKIAANTSLNHVAASIDVMKMYYDSAHAAGCCVTMLHDGSFSADFVRQYHTQTFRFMRVSDLKSYDTAFHRKFGLNDVRFFGVHDVICAHPKLGKIFVSDVFDVKVGMSPCSDAVEGTLYIGTDNNPFSFWWLNSRFEAMGGVYHQFYKERLQHDERPMWSAGIIGGGRTTLTSFFAKLLSALTDPQVIEIKYAFQTVDMPAVAFVAEKYFQGRTVGGKPLNSAYRLYERNRTDVWFIHK